MSARAGVSPRCSSSFYGGRRIPRCHNKTLAAASLAGERESYRGREEREGAAHAFAAELISESMSLLLALPPPLPLLAHFCYDLIVSCLAPPTLAHVPPGCFNHTHSPPPHPPPTLYPLVSSVNSSLLLFSHAAPFPAITYQNQRKLAG